MKASVLRRKVARPRAAEETRASPLARALPRALVRGVGTVTGLVARVGPVAERRLTLDEALEHIPDDSFVALLASSGGAGAPGLLVLAADLFAALIEVMIMGRLGPGPAPTGRRPTSTDSALMAAVVDQVLADLASAEAGAESEGPAPSWQMVRAVGDLRLLGAILDDGAFDLIKTELRLSGPETPAQDPGQNRGQDRGRGGGRGGALLLVLPVPSAPDATATRPRAAPASGREGAAASGGAAGAAGAAAGAAAGDDPFAAALAAAVAGAPVVLTAVLGRVVLPLEQALALAVGDRLELPLSRLEEVEVLGIDASLVARARLGQSQGQRALRLTALVEGEAPPSPPVLPAARDTAPPPPDAA